MSDTKLIEDAVKDVTAKVHAAFEKYEGELKEYGSVSAKTKADVKALSDEHQKLLQENAELAIRVKDLEQIGASAPKGANSGKTLGKTFVESDAFASFKNGGGSGKARFGVQANTIIGEGGSPQDPVDTIVPADRLPGIVGGAFRALTFLDFVPMGSTSSNAIEYTRELSWTNDAAETAEGGSKPESDLTFELVNEPVRTIAHWIKASKQVLDDAPALQSYIDQRMRHGVRQRLELQILRGNGTSPNLEGLSSTNKSTAFTPISGDNAFDSLNKAKYAVIGSDYTPTFIALNPADWGIMERLKVSASDDRYLAGDGAALSYLNGGLTPMIWGLPVVLSNNVQSGKFYLGASQAMMLMMRQDAVVEMFEQDGTNVQTNLITIRAELRAAFAGFRPTAVRYGSLTL